MALSPSPTAAQARSNRRGRGVTAAALAVAILGLGSWAIHRHAEARVQREKQAAEERAQVAAQKAGEDDVAARAISNYLARVHAQLRDHNAMLRLLQQEKVFSWNIQKRGDIDLHRRILREFLATNTHITESIRYGADLIRAELETAKVPAGERDSVLALYVKSQAESLPLQMHVRHCDEVLGESALTVLDFLDLNWGSWTRDQASGSIVFNSTILLATFHDYANKTKEAAAAQQAAQDELVAYQRSHPQLQPAAHSAQP